MILFLGLSLLISSNAVSAATSTTSTSKVTIAQLSTASSSVNSFYKTNKRLPNYVTINKKQVTMPQYLYLLASGTTELNSGSKASVALKNVKVPSKPTETLKKGNIKKTEYVNMAKSLKKYSDTNGKLPNYLTTSRGNMKFESTVDTYTRIMVFYKTNKRLPSYVAATPWTGKSYIAEGTSSTGTKNSTGSTASYPIITVTPTQLNTAAASLKTYIETRNKMPTKVTVAGKSIYISQFLKIISQRLSDINNGKNSNLRTQVVYMATAPAQSITSGDIQKSGYISLVHKIDSISSGGRVPNYYTTTLGKIRYESATYLFLRALNYYNTNNRLPNSVRVTKWTGTSVSSMTGGILRPVYILSDNINNAATDNARINAIVTELKKQGVTAYNYGVGPNKHYEAITNPNIPVNALIVDICGGACAGTIYDMGTSAYKYYKDTRKVYLLFTSGATKITGLSFLPRSGDDNFSPKSFTGLANPDKYLLKNGYNYYEGYTSSKLSAFVQILYKQATS